jgi:uncharacterized protein
MRESLENPVLRLERAVWASPLLRCILERWDRIALPDSWLIAGAVTQTIWNQAYGLPPTHGIKDIDLIYFDAADLSEEGEVAQEARINTVFSDCSLQFDVKNEARVHLWYARKFGYPIRPYASSWDAVATFPTTAGAVGIRPGASGLELCAPFGVEDLVRLVVRPNKAQITEEIYAAKVRRWRTMWPRLNIIDWNDA